MIDDDRYCVDIMLQISAVQGALTRVSTQILGRHLDTCVRAALDSGDANRQAEVVEELQTVFARHCR